MEALKKVVRDNPVISLVGAAATGAAVYQAYLKNNAPQSSIEVQQFENSARVNVTVEPKSVKKLQDKVALVTGSSSGIGKGVAIAYAENGAHVVVNYPSGNAKQRSLAEEVVSACRACGVKSMAIGCDVSNENEVNQMVAEVIKTYGQVDILVNNAGIASSATADLMPTEMWDQMIAINLRSVFLCTKAVLPHMYKRDYGKIVNSASQLAYKGAPGFCHYTACKGAVLSFTRSVSLEIGKRNVSINCVAPGATMTPILDNVPPAVLQAIADSIPKGKLAQVEDVVPAYVFLASDESRHFVGQCLSPNGGDVFL